jgi:hypothetical protein
MNYRQEILHFLPAQATAAALIPIALFAYNKLTMRQTVHKQRDLREKVVALNVFMHSMNEFPDMSEDHAACLQDALRQRGLNLMQLAALTAEKSRTSHPLLSRRGMRRLFLLYEPSGPLAYALHWCFFLFLFSTITGLVRGLLHVAYLREAILVPVEIIDFVLVLLLRLACFYVDRPRPERLEPAVSAV